MDVGIIAAVAVNTVLLTVVLIKLAKVSRQVEANDAALADLHRLQHLALADANDQADVGARILRNQARLRGLLGMLCARTDELFDRQCRFAALLPVPPSTPQRSYDAYKTVDAFSLTALSPLDPGLGAQPPTPISSSKQRTAPGGAAAQRTSAAPRDADGPSPKSTFEAQRQLGQVARGVLTSPRHAMNEVRKVGSCPAGQLGSCPAGQLGTRLPSPSPQKRSSSQASASSGSRYYANVVDSQRAPRAEEVRAKARHAVGLTRKNGRETGRAAHELQTTVTNSRPQQPRDLCTFAATHSSPATFALSPQTPSPPTASLMTDRSTCSF